MHSHRHQLKSEVQLSHLHDVTQDAVGSCIGYFDLLPLLAQPQRGSLSQPSQALEQASSTTCMSSDWDFES